MENELIERVARAICTANNENPDHVSLYQEGKEPVWNSYKSQAIAAIAQIQRGTVVSDDDS